MQHKRRDGMQQSHLAQTAQTQYKDTLKFFYIIQNVQGHQLHKTGICNYM